MIDECIAASRTLTAELSPRILNETGLDAALEWLARWIADKQGFSVELEMEAIGPLPYATKILLFESVRELLLNAVKHSQSRSAIVKLGTTAGSLRLVVSDRGVGFDPTTMRPAGEAGRGFGLFSIQERLELIGGQLEIASTPGKGSRFVLSVPVTGHAFLGMYPRRLPTASPARGKAHPQRVGQVDVKCPHCRDETGKLS